MINYLMGLSLAESPSDIQEEPNYAALHTRVLPEAQCRFVTARHSLSLKVSRAYLF